MLIGSKIPLVIIGRLDWRSGVGIAILEEDIMKLLLVGDFAGSHSGFAEVCNNIMLHLKDRVDIVQMGVGYQGDYHELQKDFKFYTTGDHVYGYTKLLKVIARENPDVVLIVNDPWIADQYIVALREKYKDLPVILYTPVDSQNVPSAFVTRLNLYTRVVAYTEFGKRELQESGLTVPVTVIPHGVDMSQFYPVDKYEARRILSIPDRFKFVVLYGAANQPRKRVDLFLWYMYQWLNAYPHDDVGFFYHGAVYREYNLDVFQALEYFDRIHERPVSDQFIASSEDPNLIVKKSYLKYIIGSADVFLSATPNEGWGMWIHQAMAQKIACVVGDYSAPAEWCEDGVHFVPVLDIPNLYESMCNTDHRQLNPTAVISAMEMMYQSDYYRNNVANRGFEVATQSKFHWANVANEFYNVMKEVTNE